MVPAFLAALAWTPALLGLGALVWQPGDARRRPGVSGLLGLGVAGVVATVLNLGVAIGPLVSVLVWLFGATAFVVRRRWLLEQADLGEGLLLAGVLLACSFGLRDPLFHYDTGFYHLQTVRWLAVDPIHPGIANVHHRLGFNSLWPPVAAVLEGPLGAARSAFFLNQLPVVFGAQLALVGLRRLWSGDRSLANLLLAGTLLPVASATFGLGGLYVDYTTAIVVYAAIALWARAFEAGADFSREAVAPALLSVLAPLLKMSAAVLPLTALALVMLARPRPGRDWWLRVGGLSAIAVVPWMARGLLLSGCVAFPAWRSCVDGLPWAVPEAAVRSAEASVSAWAHLPARSRAGGDWIPAWSARVLRDYPEIWLVLALLGAALVLGTLRLAGATRRNVEDAGVTVEPSPRRLPGWLAAALLGTACVAFSFVTAPEPRFALGALLALGVLPLAALLAIRRGPVPPRANRILAGSLVIVSLGLALILHDHPRTGTRTGLPPWRAPALAWPQTPEASVEVRTTDCGLQVLVSATGEYCGAAPVPCMPAAEFNRALCYDGDSFVVPR